MEFIHFNKQLQNHLTALLKNADRLFVANVDKDVLWNTYLDSFPEGTNPMFRKRREFDCSCCRAFIKELGALIVIKDNKPVTLWSFKTQHPYDTVVKALEKYILSCGIRDIYFAPHANIGQDRSRDSISTNIVWDHFYVSIPSKFVRRREVSIESLQGEARDVRNVLKRGLDEITPSSLSTVLELISQGSLYRGEEWKNSLESFQRLQGLYLNMKSEQERSLYTWNATASTHVAKIRNSAVGTLLQDISEGMNLDRAVSRYEKIVAPANYKRPKAIFTQKMLDDAKKTIEDLGFKDSLARRFAVIDDVSVADVLFVDREVAKKMVGGDVFDSLSKSTKKTGKQNYSNVQEIHIDKFLADVVPHATKIELLFENRHASNLVSLLSPENKSAPSMFKWPNGFSWAYKNNIADSMKELVKQHGGKVDGDLRFSIQWNDANDNHNDLDAHCREPNGNRIYYATKTSQYTRGQLDVDVRVPGDKIAVENITWASRKTMKPGTYEFFVHNFSETGAKSGFTAEIEFDGQLYSFEVARPLKYSETVHVASVSYSNGEFKLEKSLANTSSSKSTWNIETNNFHRVQFISHSPNHWENSSGIGNKHVFFMLENCISDETPNGFFNEFLNPSLEKHKRVFEALGTKMKVKPSNEQLSGLGFSSQKNDVICRVEGQMTRVLKITF